MRRAGDLFERIASFGALLAAAARAARGKRRKRPVARFLVDLEPELLGLERELLDGSWRPGPFRTFTIADPKPRRIAAVPFRDRVVHHALMAVLGPILERTLIADTYACREGRGGHAALRRAQACARGGGFFLKTDIEHCFETVDQEATLALVGRKVKCRRTMELLSRIVRVPVAGSLPGKGHRVARPLPRDHVPRRGRPLGGALRAVAEAPATRTARPRAARLGRRGERRPGDAGLGHQDRGEVGRGPAERVGGPLRAGPAPGRGGAGRVRGGAPGEGDLRGR